MEINAQFQKFVDFARGAQEAGGAKSVARVGEDAGLGGHAISASTTDKVAAFARSRANKDANDAARVLFRQSVIDMFGGESKIPENVRKAMNLKDYGAGKPLTARRILAVQSEIAKASDLFDQAFAATKAAAASVYAKCPAGDAAARANLDRLVETAVKTALKDGDALEIVKKNIEGILVRGDAALRSADAVEKKVADIMANLAEIREAAGGDKGMVKAGVSFLKLMGGKSVQPGVLANIVRAVKNADVGDIKKLSGSSRGLAIHKAVEQFTRLQVELAVSSGAEAALDGADEKVAARDFIADLLVAKCGASNVAKMQAALSGDNAKKTAFLYDAFETGRFDKADFPKGLLEHVSAMSARASNMLIQLKLSVDTYMGVSDDERKGVGIFKGKFDTAEFGASKIFSDLVASAKVQSGKVYDSVMPVYVGGNGPAADAFRAVVTKRIGREPGLEPIQDVRYDAGRNIIGMVNWNICQAAREFALGNGRTSFFALDLARGMKVNLPGGKRLSNDYDTALNELAAFVTKGAKASYAALDPKEKTKVHIVVSFLSQECGRAAFEGQAAAFDPKNAVPPFVTASDQNADFREYTVALGDNGDLLFNFIGRQELQTVTFDDGKGGALTCMAKKGSTLEAEVAFKLPAVEFERMSGLDFTKFDDSTTGAHMGDLTMSGRLEKIPQTFGEEFRFKGDSISCNSRIHAEFK